MNKFIHCFYFIEKSDYILQFWRKKKINNIIFTTFVIVSLEVYGNCGTYSATLAFTVMKLVLLIAFTAFFSK